MLSGSIPAPAADQELACWPGGSHTCRCKGALGAGLASAGRASRVGLIAFPYVRSRPAPPLPAPPNLWQAKRATFNKRMGQQVRDRLRWVVKRRHL
jgi:hypothetical protein